jgi:hypothetical protein
MSDLESWLYKWEIKIITDKSTAEIFTKGRQVLRKRLKRFEQGIPWSTEAKYLAIHHYRSLTWKAHIKAIASKAMQRFVAVYSIFKCLTLNKKLKTCLYKSLIPPFLLYGVAACGHKQYEAVADCPEQKHPADRWRGQIYIKYINTHTAGCQNLKGKD